VVRNAMGDYAESVSNQGLKETMQTNKEKVG